MRTFIETVLEPAYFYKNPCKVLFERLHSEISSSNSEVRIKEQFLRIARQFFFKEETFRSVFTG